MDNSESGSYVSSEEEGFRYTMEEEEDLGENSSRSTPDIVPQDLQQSLAWENFDETFAQDVAGVQVDTKAGGGAVDPVVEEASESEARMHNHSVPRRNDNPSKTKKPQKSQQHKKKSPKGNKKKLQNKLAMWEAFGLDSSKILENGAAELEGLAEDDKDAKEDTRGETPSPKQSEKEGGRTWQSLQQQAGGKSTTTSTTPHATKQAATSPRETNTDNEVNPWDRLQQKRPPGSAARKLRARSAAKKEAPQSPKRQLPEKEDSDSFQSAGSSELPQTNGVNQSPKKNGKSSPKKTPRDIKSLTPKSSRLALYANGLKNRFEDQKAEDDNDDRDNNKSEDFASFPVNVPFQDDSKGGEQKEKNKSTEEESFGSSWEKFGDPGTTPSSTTRLSPTTAKNKANMPLSQVLEQRPKGTKEMDSASWAEFDDDAWSQSQNQKRESVASGQADAKQTLSKVSESSALDEEEDDDEYEEDDRDKVDPSQTSISEMGGNSTDVQFWGDDGSEGQGSETDAVAQALKPKLQESQQVVVEASSQTSTEDLATRGAPRASLLGGMFGAAYDYVATMAPFSRSNDDDAVEEQNVVEVEDLPYAEGGENGPETLATSDFTDDLYDASYVDRSIRLSGGVILDVFTPENAQLGVMDGPDDENLRDSLFKAENPFTGDEGGIEQFADGEVEDGVSEKEGTEDEFALPLYDMCLDLPHPAVASTSAPATYIGTPFEDPEIESEISESIQKIIRFAFPDYDEASLRPKTKKGHNVSEQCGFQNYFFPFRLPSGTMMYGHVRRYLPPHPEAMRRYDVGRRGERALIIFTRSAGSGEFYAAILKTLDAITAQQATIANTGFGPQKWFLHSLFHRHQQLCGQYAAQPEDRCEPFMLTIQGLEFSALKLFSYVDVTHFQIPRSLLYQPLVSHMKVTFTCTILPLMRCLGVVNSLRVFSALMSEQRILLVSCSPTRLANCARAALSMLAQGMLNWKYPCIPVLPPDLWACVLSQSPYLIGILSHMADRLIDTDDLGEVMIVDLDENNITAHGMSSETFLKRIPDLCRGMAESTLKNRRIFVPTTIEDEREAAEHSTSDFLAQDLINLLKEDKSIVYGNAVRARVVAKKSMKAMKSTLRYLMGADDKGGEGQAFETKKTKREKAKEPAGVYIEGSRIEIGEEEVRMAFVAFYLRMLGNIEGYMVADNHDESPRFRKDLFLQLNSDRGDGPGSPIWQLLLNFSETRILHDFARFRAPEIQAQDVVPDDAPLFWHCVSHHRKECLDFGLLNARSAVRKITQISSSEQMVPTSGRRLAMALTSKTKFDGDVSGAISALAELSRESNANLFDVMSVLWVRMRDSKGLQWVHGYQALKIFRQILLHGPIAAVAEATDGLDQIRSLIHNRSQGSEQIRSEALEIYKLIVDRSKLFLRRRICAEQRRLRVFEDDQNLTRDSRLHLKTSFKDAHLAMNPQSHIDETKTRQGSLKSRRASLGAKLAQRKRFSLSNHLNLLEETGSVGHQGADRGQYKGELGVAKRIVREIARRTANSGNQPLDAYGGRGQRGLSIELLKQQFMMLKFAIYVCPIFYYFDHHEIYMSIVMFLWLSQQFQVFRTGPSRSN